MHHVIAVPGCPGCQIDKKRQEVEMAAGVIGTFNVERVASLPVGSPVSSSSPIQWGYSSDG